MKDDEIFIGLVSAGRLHMKAQRNTLESGGDVPKATNWFTHEP